MIVIDNYRGIFEKAALVVAHPDDEILWLSSVLAHVGSIVFCFMDYPDAPLLGVGRRQAMAEYPFPNVISLDIEEAMSFRAADWACPVESPYGLMLTRNKAIEAKYRHNFDELYKKLSPVLSGVSNVFTHNPWGEYGHEDHVQVYRVVTALQREKGFNVWYSNYCGNGSVNLMLKYISGFSADYITLPTNLKLADSISSIYKKHECWTWYEDYTWFMEESLMKYDHSNQSGPSYGHIFPLNMIKTDFSSGDIDRTTGLRGILHKLKHPFSVK